MHWDHEPRAVARPTESADKSDALQTLRALRRRPAVAKRLECVRLQRRFPKTSYDSMTGQLHGEWARGLFSKVPHFSSFDRTGRVWTGALLVSESISASGGASHTRTSPSSPVEKIRWPSLEKVTPLT